MSARAKAQALEALIEAHATELKLPTLKGSPRRLVVNLVLGWAAARP